MVSFVFFLLFYFYFTFILFYLSFVNCAHCVSLAKSCFLHTSRSHLIAWLTEADPPRDCHLEVPTIGIRSTAITPNVRVRTMETKEVEESSPYYLPQQETERKHRSTRFNWPSSFSASFSTQTFISQPPVAPHWPMCRCSFLCILIGPVKACRGQ